MKLNTRCVLVTLVVLLAATSSPAKELNLGDPAPALKVAKWVKGEAVDLAAGRDTNIFVLEIWSTTCPHCRNAITTLNNLQKEYAGNGVIIVGLTGDDQSRIESFLKRTRTEIEYRVGVDQDEETARAYMTGFGATRIPHTFVIDKSGRVVWHGHPVSGKLGDVLQLVVDGKHDLKAGQTQERARKLIPEYFRMATHPKRAEEAGKIGAKIVSSAQGDAYLLDDFAWKIITKRGLVKRDMELALRAAKSAYDLNGGKDPRIIDTYARALFECGRAEEAVRYQKEALDIAKSAVVRREMQASLARYQKADSKKGPVGEKASKPVRKPAEKPQE